MNNDLDKLLLQLQQDSSLKVWSLIVTFFGDAIVARGGNVSAKTVQTVLSGMGVGSGAVRTAFSRLAGDRWIVRQKIGRESFYDLAKEGYLPFQNASARIYSASVALQSDGADWTVVIKDPAVKINGSSALQNCMQLTTNCWLLSAAEFEALNSSELAGFMRLTGQLDKLPEWVTGKLLPEPLAAGYKQLEERFSTVRHAGKLDPLESMVLRCLLIHQWRRILLRTHQLPPKLQPANWPEDRCREFVADLYCQILPGSEAWLDEHATCASGALPAPGADLKHRFTESYHNAS